MDLIKIHKTVIGNEEINSVNAREIYTQLEIGKDFSSWIKQQIERLNLHENKNYLKVTQKGESKIEYIVDIDSAKNICLISFTPKGQEIRDYFISCETKLKQQLQLPNNYLEALKALTIEVEHRQLLENKVHSLTHASKLYTTSEIAKELNFKSATALNLQLNEDDIQYKQNGTWLLYSKYSDKNFVSIKQDILDNGKIIYDRKWTGVGRDFLIEKYTKETK